MKFLYLLVDLFTIIIPLIFSFHPKIKFYKTWKAFLIASVSIAVIFATWDIVFTNLGVWDFNLRYITGIFFFKLPIEEILFFICIPFSCIFTYYCLNKFYNLSWNPEAENIFSIILCLFLLITGLIFLNRLYTSVTFISTAFVCFILKFILKINWFGRAISVYAILLVPFFIVNGILTGTGLEEPVVRYNNSENLHFRLLSIPVEDLFYGFELYILNLFIYLHLIDKKDKEVISGKI
ncbi:MAG: lycopene cyclase domain-containing protein [Bacteroidota bacterium]|nr:lycopene cyclase domain-containing protein [Bacteroidota bacterium]